jgi:hypothetical protein
MARGRGSAAGPGGRRMMAADHQAVGQRIPQPGDRRSPAGDQSAAAYWSGREQAFQEILHRANLAALEYLQAWAGVTRTGYHGTLIDGREPGRFEPAGVIVTSWL